MDRPIKRDFPTEHSLRRLEALEKRLDIPRVSLVRVRLPMRSPLLQRALPPRPDPEVRSSKEDRQYGITIDASLITGHEDLLGKLSMRGNKVNVISRFRRQIALRDYVAGLVEGRDVAKFLESTFHDLHWIGLTPDRVVRYIPKRLLVQPYDYRTPRHDGTRLSLGAVEMRAADIEASLKDLSEKWRLEQEAHFGA